MRSRALLLAPRAGRLLAQKQIGEAGTLLPGSLRSSRSRTSSTTTNSSKSSAEAAAAAGATPKPGSSTPPPPGTRALASSAAPSPGGAPVSPAPGVAATAPKKSGGGGFGALVLAACAAGGYYAYEQGLFDAAIQGAGPVAWDPKKAWQGAQDTLKGLPAKFGVKDTPPANPQHSQRAPPAGGGSSSSSGHLGGKAPPEAAAATSAATTTGSSSSSAATGDSLTAAADEFPGSTTSSSKTGGDTGSATTTSTSSSKSGGEGSRESVAAAKPSDATAADPGRAAALVDRLTSTGSELTSRSRQGLTDASDSQLVLAAADAAAAAATAARHHQRQSPQQPAAGGSKASAGQTAGQSQPSGQPPTLPLAGHALDMAAFKKQQAASAEVKELLSTIPALPADVADAVNELVNPQALLNGAVTAGLAPADPLQLGLQTQQAVADAAAAAAVVKGVVGHLGEVRQQLEQQQHLVEAMRSEHLLQLKSLTQRFEAQLSAQRVAAEDERSAAVAAAHWKAAAEAAEKLVEERQGRLAQLDAVRGQLNALGQALKLRTDEAAASWLSHRVTLGVLALGAALEQRAPLVGLDKALAGAAAADPLVEAVVGGLPPVALTKGVPTQSDLEARFPAVATAARRQSYFAPGSGGLVATVVAAAAAGLKFADTAAAANAGGLDAQLSKAQELLRQQRLQEAADLVASATAGTKAAAAVASWVEDTRARAAVQQALAALQARATCAALEVAS